MKHCLSLTRHSLVLALLLVFSGAANGQQQNQRPNILIIWGDDVGTYNISAYHRGMMGGSTPNIDRIGEGRHDLHGSLRASRHARRGARHSLPGSIRSA